MSKIKKINAIIVLSLVIIMLSSSFSVADTPEKSDPSTDTADQIKAINIDVKVKKINELSSENNEWLDEISVLVNDVVRVKVTVSNIIKHDLVDITVLNRLPSSDYFTFLSSPTFEEEMFDDNVLTWKISELKSGEEVSFEFNMKAVLDTDANGVMDYANASGFIDPTYYVELDQLEAQLQGIKLELNSVTAKLDENYGKLTSLVQDVDGLVQQKQVTEKDILQLNNLIAAKDSEKIQKESELESISSELHNLANDKNTKESELASIQMEKSTLQSKLDTKITEITQISTELENEQQTLTTLQQQLAQSTQILENKNREIQTIENEIIDLTSQINQFTDQQNLIQQEITQMTSILTTKDEETANIQYQIDAKEDEINNQIYRITQLNEELVKEQKELAVLKDNLELISKSIGKEKEIATLKSQIQAKETSVQQKTEQIGLERSKLNQNINELNNLVDQKNLKDNEITQIKDQITTKETELAQVQSQISTKQDELTNKQSDLNQLNVEKETKNQEITDLNNQIQNQQDAIAQKTQQKQSVENEINGLISQINELTNQQNLVQQELIQITSQITTKQNEKTQKETELESINSELQSLANDKNIKENELTNINGQITSKQNEINTLTEETNQLNTQKQQLEQDISLLSDEISARRDELSRTKVYSEDTARLYVNKIPLPSIDVEKKAWDEQSGQWVDEITLDINDPAKFSIDVSNTGNVDLSNIVVTDIFPSEILQYVCTVSPYVPEVSGNYVIWNIEKLSAGESISVELNTLAIKDGTGTNNVKVNAKKTQITTPDGTAAQDEGVFDEDSVIINVKSQEHTPPVAVDDYVTVDEDSSNNLIDVLANDYIISADNNITVELITEPAHGTAVIVDNKIAYTPSPDYNGEDSLTYQIHGALGGTDTAQVFITVNNINDPPVAVDDQVSTYVNTPAEFDVVANDYDIDGDQIILNSIETKPVNGLAYIVDGKLRYEPNADFVGSDSLVYDITDGNEGYDSATVLIEVIKESENTPPIAIDDQATVYVNSANNTIDVLKNDYDEDGDAISIDSITSQPTSGLATISGNAILYTPNEGFNGTDSFEYKITDGNGGYDTATVTINVIEKMIVIVKPSAGHLYFRNRELLKVPGLLKFVDADAIIIGPITIKAEINETEFTAVKVDFFIDDDLMNSTTEKPYNWTLKQHFFGICTIKAVAYDSEDNTISDQIDVLILNFGLFTNKIGDNSRLRLR